MSDARTGPEALRAVTHGLAELLERYRLGEACADRFLTLIRLVASDPLSPTAVRDPPGILADHLADSLVALELDEVRAASTLADLGSGAGFPGLPLAVALPDTQVMLVESSGRKGEFIQRVIDACGIPNARVIHARAEELPAGTSNLDVITARALAPLPVVAEYAAPLLRLGGLLVAWRGRRDPDAEAAAERAAAQLGLRVRAALHVHPYPAAEHRYLHLIEKVEPTPARFPRRPGTARKRPLGGR